MNVLTEKNLIIIHELLARCQPTTIVLKNVNKLSPPATPIIIPDFYLFCIVY